MTEKQKDDIYYVCSLIEYIARKTKNHRLKERQLEKQLDRFREKPDWEA